MRRLATLAVVVVSVWMSASARAETLEWIRQLGTSSADRSGGVSADRLGSVYISGRTDGSLGGTSAGDYDAFLAKYSASGTMEWTRQLGTSQSDSSLGVSADGLGSVYTSGYTRGSLEGANAGERDAFLAKYNASGTLEWTQQLGTSGYDETFGVSADGLGSVYISGRTNGSLDGNGTNAGEYDAYISKYDASGTLQWTRQLGTSGYDASYCVSADGLGNVFIAGETHGNLAEPLDGTYDTFISKYDASGTLEWTRQFSNNNRDAAVGVSADGLGSVYISRTGGPSFNDVDAFINKYDASGTLEWTQQIGTSSTDRSGGVSSDGLGSVYISGYTRGSLGGTSAGDYDAFLAKYSASGTLQWTQQLGTSAEDLARGVSSDGLGSVYISGYTEGSLGGPNAGGRDAFVAKFTDLLLGDLNLDGDVNGLDVDPFVEVLLGGPYQTEADMNGDQVVNGLDVDPFVAAVVGGAQSVPEPTTLLLCIALSITGAWRKWGV